MAFLSMISSGNAFRKASRSGMLGVVLALSLPLSACISISDTTLFTKPESDAQSAAERDQLIAMFGGVYNADDRLIVTITQVTERIVKASHNPNAKYRLMILNSPSINAFALPSGDIFITRGLLAFANDTAEIGAVIAHEIAHVTAHHASHRAELEKAITEVPKEIQAGEASMSGSGSRFKLASFSRFQELEADEIGIKTLAKAGYDPFGATRFLLALNRMSNLDNNQSLRRKSRASFLASHPSTPQRLSVAIDTASAHLNANSIEADRALYLSSLNNLAFGDDPEAGMINGKQFYHPRLDFFFEAPDGFLLENSSQAVIGINAAREQSMRLDTIMGKNAEDSLVSGWIEGARLDALVPLDIPGFTAVTTTAKDQEWQYRLAAIEKDDKVFRIIFAARVLTPEIDQTFLQSIHSFRTLSPDETAMLKPLKLKIIRAESGDTVDTMAARMTGISHAQDLFQLLNGIERNGVKEGLLYKIIVQK